MASEREMPPRRRSPYKGLVPYDEEDAPFFFGREKETRLIVANLFASPLTLLYGASGVGKSSVLRAGVAHRLRPRADLVLISFASWQGEPAVQLKSTIAEAVAAIEIPFAAGQGGLPSAQLQSTLTRIGGSGHRLSADTPLAPYLSQCATSLNRRIMIILDQFEEYFLYHPVDDALAAELPAAVMIEDAPVSFLLAIRDDHLSRLDRFEGRIPNLFDTCFRVEHLDRPSAERAIREPIKKYNSEFPEESRFEIQDELVESVLDAVRAGELLLGESGRGVVKQGIAQDKFETPYLQLVMTRLWDQELENRSRLLRLDTLRTLGGAKTIVREHLDKALAALPPAEQDIAARVFHFLVTPSGTKIAHSATDLVEYAEAPHEEIVVMLEKLSRGESRILRGIKAPFEPEPRYEIFHDALVPAILDWRSRYVQRQQREKAQEQLRKQRLEADKRAQEQESELRQQALIARRLRRLLAALILMFVVAGALAIFAGIQTRRANENAERAEESAQDALRLKNEAIAQKKRNEKTLATLQEAVAANLATSEAPAETAKGEDKLREVLAVTQLTDRPTLSAQQERIKAQTLEPVSARRYGLRNKLWQNGRTLQIRFMDGDPAVQAKVASIADEWTKYANLRFAFGDGPDAQIRVSFKDPGSWSYVGTDALVVSRNQQTMNLGYITNSTPDDEIRRMVLLEFGHVLGLINEHQNPNASIPWDVPAVYRYFGGAPYNWSKAMIDQQILSKYQIEYRGFDPKSIMNAFAIPNDLTVGDFETQFNTDLSESDKEFVRELYPPE